jgi:DNA-directed RNA polymerase subunit beta'
VAQDVIISEEDCGTLRGISASAIVEGGEEIESLRDRIVGRTALEDVSDPIEGSVIVASNQEIDEDLAAEIQRSGVQRVRIRSVLDLRIASRLLHQVLRTQPRNWPSG